MNRCLHMSVPIRDLRRRVVSRAPMQDTVLRPDGTPCTVGEAFDALLSLEIAGYRALPIGDCDNAGPDGCLGHEVTQ